MPTHRLHWRYKNLTLLSFGLFAGIFLYNSDVFRQIILSLGGLSYLGIFIAGILYDSTFTVSTSLVSLLIFAERFPIIPLVLIATAGAVLGDYIVFKYVKNGLVQELAPLANNIEDKIGRRRISYVKHLFHSKYFHWMLPVVAAIMVGSPFPNELALGILGVSGVQTRTILFISSTFNFLGISIFVNGFNFLLT